MGGEAIARGKNERQAATKSQRAESSGGSLCLELLGGARVTGLTLAQVAELLRGQTCAFGGPAFARRIVTLRRYSK